MYVLTHVSASDYKTKYMKLLLLIPFFFAFSFSKIKTKIPSPIAPSDTCFYSINVPPDIDMPSTPHFDTTIVRNNSCKVHILKLQSWGTETEYNLSGTINGKTYSRNAHFFHGPGSGSNTMDITDLPAGDYGMYLLACGNGGGFGLRIK